MFMKHTISRFFRFFLVAALVAAMAGSLLPAAKVAGQGGCTVSSAQSCATVSTSTVLADRVGWVLEFEVGATAIVADTVAEADGAYTPGGIIEIAFPTGTRMPDSIAGKLITVASSDDGSGAGADPPSTDAVPVGATALTVHDDNVVIISDGTITINSPVAIADGAMGTVTIADAAKVAHDTTAGEQTGMTVGGNMVPPYETTRSPLVTTSGQRAGEVVQWRIDFQVDEELTADVSEITLAFSHASIPSAIERSAISVRRTDAPPDTAAAALVTVAPTTLGSSITFFTPLGLSEVAITDEDGPRDKEIGTIVISTTAGVSHKTSPSVTAKVTVTAGDNDAQVSETFSVNRYLNFSPSTAALGATVTVSGGGFTAGTRGLIDIGSGPPYTSTNGTYDVDSAGKLSGSFLVSSRTTGANKISVQDLGPVLESIPSRVYSERNFTQKASATPSGVEVTRGAPVRVTLNDFPSDKAGTKYTAVIANAEAVFTVSSDGRSGSLTVKQGEDPGTKLVTITGTPRLKADDPETDLDEEELDKENAATASFLITIVRRTLTVSPSAAVPGQAITVTGSGFTTSPEGSIRVHLTLSSSGGTPVKLTGDTDGDGVEDVSSIRVNTDGTFLYTGKVPFEDGITDKPGTKEWTATELGGKRAASSSGFSIQKRVVTLSPSTANPGTSVEVFGSGWGVRTYGDVTSQVTVTLPDAEFGPFPVSSSGEFTGAITVPSNSQTTTIKVIAEDNNGGRAGSGDTATVAAGKTGGFGDNQSESANLRVPTGVVTVTPSTASTGTIITVSGTGFPAQTNLSALTFGSANALPVPAPATDVTGRFTVTLGVPAAGQGGSLQPGAVVITATVGRISGTTSFTIPGPSVSLSSSTARPGDSMTITGTGFSAYGNVTTVSFGSAPALPVPNPRTDGIGDFSASVIVPTLNPGAYTITVRTGAAFTATAPIRILSATSGRTVSPEIAFQALTSRGLLTLAAAASPGGTEFGAFVPGLAGNTLVQVEPNGVLILTLNADARISVSSQPAVDVSADTPTFFAIGSAVTVEVIE